MSTNCGSFIKSPGGKEMSTGDVLTKWRSDFLPLLNTGEMEKRVRFRSRRNDRRNDRR